MSFQADKIIEEMKLYQHTSPNTDYDGLIANFNLLYRSAKTKGQQLNLLTLLPAEWSYNEMKQKLYSKDQPVLVSRGMWKSSQAIQRKLGPMPEMRPKVIKSIGTKLKVQVN